MKRRVTASATMAAALLVLALLVAGAVGASALASGGSAGQVGIQDGGNNTTDVAPGEKLAGVVGVQQAEVRGAVEERSFAVALARAGDRNATAAVVADRLRSVNASLADLRERRESLREARANGSISQGEFAAEMAEIAARARTVRRLANASGSVTAGLPAGVLEANGVDATAIAMIRERARNLSGPQVAAIARGIAGRPPGAPFGRDRGNLTPGSVPGVGPGDGRNDGNATQGTGAGEVEQTIQWASTAVGTAETAIGEASALVIEGSPAADTLAAARANLSTARDLLETARTRAADGDHDAALSAATAALERAETASALAAEATATAGGTTSGGGSSGDGSGGVTA